MDDKEVLTALHAMERETLRLALVVDVIPSQKKAWEEMTRTLRDVQRELETIEKLIQLKKNKE
jgi:hypothetical protein